MGDSDDGIQLNLTPYEFKPKKPKQQQQQQQVKENTGPNQSNNHNGKQNHNKHKPLKSSSEKVKKTSKKNARNATGKREYIDPKDFVPVSNLFNKNPEIPEVSIEPATAEKSEQVLFTT